MHRNRTITGFDISVLESSASEYKGQNDILSRPFEHRQELTEKRARYTELMAELNPKEEQFGDDDVQEQGRYFAEDEDKPIAKTRKSLYSEQESLFYQWAYSKEKAGNVAKFVRFGKHKFYEKTADYCIEISSEEYKKAKGYNVGNTNSKTNDEVRELVTDDGASVRTNVGNNGGINGNAEMQSVSQQTLGEELRNDTGGSVSGVDRYNTGNDIEETQNQPRTETYSDREILEMAANETSSDEYTAEEKNALSIFRSHAEKLHELEDERAEQGGLYVEQQFSKNSNRAEAQKTKNRMDILDGQIQREEEALLSIENKKVLKDILKKARRIIEKKDSEKAKEALKRYCDRRDNSAKIKKYRERIQKNVNDLSAWVLDPNNKEAVKHIPEIIRNDVIGFLTSIDFTSKRQLSGKAATMADAEFANRLERLRNAIRENVSVNGLYSGYNDLPEGFLSGEKGETGRLDRHIERIKSLLENGEDGYIINRMTSYELKELSEIVENLKAYVQNMNAFLANEAYQHVYEAGDNTVEYLRSLGNDSSRRATAGIQIFTFTLTKRNKIY